MQTRPVNRLITYTFFAVACAAIWYVIWILVSYGG